MKNLSLILTVLICTIIASCKPDTKQPKQASVSIEEMSELERDAKLFEEFEKSYGILESEHESIIADRLGEGFESSKFPIIANPNCRRIYKDRAYRACGPATLLQDGTFVTSLKVYSRRLTGFTGGVEFSLRVADGRPVYFIRTPKWGVNGYSSRNVVYETNIPKAIAAITDKITAEPYHESTKRTIKQATELGKKLAGG